MILEKLRPYLLRIIILLVIIIGLSVLLNLRTYGWVEVSVPKDTVAGPSVAFTLRHDEQVSQEFKVTAGQTKKVRVKTGLVRVDSSGGSIHSVDMVQVKSFKTTKLTAPTGEQHAIKQLASDLKYCPVLVSERIYSYDCLGQGPVLRHTDPHLGNTRNVALFGEQLFNSVKPVKDGLIGFTDADQSENRVNMFFINLVNESVQQINLPSSVPSISGQFPDVVVSNDGNSSRFALVFTRENKIYLFDNIDDKDPVLIEPKQAKTTETGRIARGSFSGDRFVLYLGTSMDLNEGHENDDQSKLDAVAKLKHFVIEYDMQGKEAGVIYLPPEISSQGIYKLSNDFYLAEDNEGFDFYHREDNGLKQVYSMTGMAGWTIRDGKAYVQNNNILYEFVPKTGGLFSLNSRFGSSSIRVSQVFNTAEGIVFTGFAPENSNESANLYRLLPELETGLYEGQVSNSRVEPDYSDLRRLTNGGLTAYQVANLHYALDGFFETLPSAPKEMLAGTIAITPHDRFSASRNNSLTFDVVLDDSLRYKAKVEYNGVLAINLWVYDLGGNQVYNSGEISGAQPDQQL